LCQDVLANEYWSVLGGEHEAKCGGNCTLSEQLLWLQLIESFRKRDANFYFDDTGVIGYETVAYILDGPYGTSWMWGNLTPPAYATITAGPMNTPYGPYVVYSLE
jgi:hypothetical protein